MVNISVESEASKELQNVQLEYENLSDNYSINAASDADKYTTIVVKGVKSVLDKLDSKDIKAYVDLSDLEPGTYEVPVMVTGNDLKLSYSSRTTKIEVIIAKK